MPVFRLLAASAAVAAVAAICSVNSVSLLPPKLTPKHLEVAGARTHALVDHERSGITDRRADWAYFNVTRTGADVLAHLAATAPALEHIGRRAGIPADRIAAVAPVTASVTTVLIEPGSEQRAREIALSRRPYRLEIQWRSGYPLLDVYAQAPSPGEAERLATAAIAGVGDYVRESAAREGVGPGDQLRLLQLGPARSAVLNAGAATKIAGLTFLVVFSLTCAALVALRRLVSRRRPTVRDDPEPRREPPLRPPRDAAIAFSPIAGPPVLSAPGVATAAGALRAPAPTLRFPLRLAATRDGDWPYTTRVLPWMLAGFMTMLWLVPFDSIQLTIPTPVDLKLDRILLPFIVAVWLLSLAAGGVGAPRVRATRIHAAVGAFVALAGASVILDAGQLNTALELDTSLKKLPLLVAFLTLFVVAASVVRRSEVAAFLTFTLALAVLCALGMIWEYRLQTNLFFDWSNKLLPGTFEVSDDIATGYDISGRLATHGPTAHGLVATAMLAMALPIAIVRLLHADRWGVRIVYILAGCVLMVGILATQRKTGIVAPLAGILTLAYFRRRELLRLAPLAVVMLVALLIVSPGTIAPVVEQFSPDRLGADTVSDRASDYDAIRPDVWTNIAFGRGYGSYQPLGHRILDSEILLRTIEMGVLGLVAFFMLGVTVVARVRGTIASRHPLWAAPALETAAAAVVFLVVAFLFDAMAYPQTTYVLLCFAAFGAALGKPREQGAAEPGAQAR